LGIFHWNIFLNYQLIYFLNFRWTDFWLDFHFCNISSSCDVVYKGRWLTQAGYWFILRFCEHFTCLNSKIQNAIKLENISNLITSPIILNNSIFSASAVHNKSGCSDVTPAVKLAWRPSVNSSKICRFKEHQNTLLLRSYSDRNMV
jgi:hypothetical protein